MIWVKNTNTVQVPTSNPRRLYDKKRGGMAKDALCSLSLYPCVSFTGNSTYYYHRNSVEFAICKQLLVWYSMLIVRTKRIKKGETHVTMDANISNRRAGCRRARIFRSGRSGHQYCKNIILHIPGTLPVRSDSTGPVKGLNSKRK